MYLAFKCYSGFVLFAGCIWPCCEEWSENESDLHIFTEVPSRPSFVRVYKPNSSVDRHASFQSLVSTILNYALDLSFMIMPYEQISNKNINCTAHGKSGSRLS